MIKMQPEMTEMMKIKHFHSLLRKNPLQTFQIFAPLTGKSGTHTGGLQAKVR